jgi:glycosyltransferase involved in cell wall biosynthesis
MAILILHGYLLKGTGSNLYVRNLTRQLCSMGNDVVLLCQEDNPREIDFIQEAHELLPGNRDAIRVFARQVRLKGRCVMIRPHIGALLPVFVHDHYSGFEVKTFPECTEEEIEYYVDQNRRAVEWVLDHFQIQVVQTNHLIMLPYVMATLKQRRSHCPEYFCTLHGSALNFSVRRDPRLVRYAEAGLGSAEMVFVDSLYAREELNAFWVENRLSVIEDRTRVIPAGVDIGLFQMPEGRPRGHFLHQLAAGLTDHPGGGRSPDSNAEILHRPLPGTEEEISQLCERIRTSYDYLAPDSDAAEKLSSLAAVNDRLVLYVGKYLWTKGIHLLLFSIPFILDRHPNTQFLLIGFGPFREPAEIILNCMLNRRLDTLDGLIGGGNPLFFTDRGDPIPLLESSWQHLREPLERVLTDTMVAKLRGTVHFTGIMNHEQLRWLLPCADLLVAPSVFPEAFGMVAVEALSCGVYPVLTYQSAFREIVDEMADLSARFNLPAAKIALDENAALLIAKTVDTAFGVLDRLEDRAELNRLRRSLRDLAASRYSWRAVAASYLRHYGGHAPAVPRV